MWDRRDDFLLSTVTTSISSSSSSSSSSSGKNKEKHSGVNKSDRGLSQNHRPADGRVRDRKRVKAAERDRKRALLELLASIVFRHLPANENISQMSADTDSTGGYFNPQLNSD